MFASFLSRLYCRSEQPLKHTVSFFSVSVSLCSFDADARIVDCRRLCTLCVCVCVRDFGRLLEFLKVTAWVEMFCKDMNLDCLHVFRTQNQQNAKLFLSWATYQPDTQVHFLLLQRYRLLCLRGILTEINSFIFYEAHTLNKIVLVQMIDRQSIMSTKMGWSTCPW